MKLISIIIMMYFSLIIYVSFSGCDDQNYSYDYSLEKKIAYTAPGQLNELPPDFVIVERNGFYKWKWYDFFYCRNQFDSIDGAVNDAWYEYDNQYINDVFWEEI